MTALYTKSSSSLPFNLITKNRPLKEWNPLKDMLPAECYRENWNPLYAICHIKSTYVSYLVISYKLICSMLINILFNIPLQQSLLKNTWTNLTPPPMASNLLINVILFTFEWIINGSIHILDSWSFCMDIISNHS